MRPEGEIRKIIDLMLSGYKNSTGFDAGCYQLAASALAWSLGVDGRLPDMFELTIKLAKKELADKTNRELENVRELCKRLATIVKRTCKMTEKALGAEVDSGAIRRRLLAIESTLATAAPLVDKYRKLLAGDDWKPVHFGGAAGSSMPAAVIIAAEMTSRSLRDTIEILNRKGI